ncbi:Heat shock protein HslJ [Chitinophaga sp. CF118]|uniref:META domain-containing protein n=1 Tax=Chitinophaga sp. CF118 TaxID=1884367 RepID=UPI0008EAC921|nr:META domain-containing protein [Chitinophaga sp. CF118]SFE70310.1 Heat shock protein HslJ [Chitinophaga sp. CF118]
MFYKLTLTLAVLLANTCNHPPVKKESSPVVVQANTTGSVWHYIQQKRWKLIQMQGKMQEPSPSMWLEFDTTTHRFSGNGGCNKLAGAFTVAGDVITFQKVQSTLMACLDQKANERETDILRLLSDHTYTFDVADQTLQLYDSSKIILMFGAQGKDEK